jgi:hypothetical protein
MRVRPPPSSTGEQCGRPPFSDTPATRGVPGVYALCASFRNGSSHSLSSRCDKARNSMC